MSRKSEGKKTRKRKKKPKVQFDRNGEFTWETYFIGGKQKRRKVRPTVSDEWLLNNANFIDLYKEGRFELLHQREQEDKEK